MAENSGENTPTIDNEESAEESAEGTVEVPEDFDPERALRTIRQQRQAEKELKAQLAEAQAKAAELDKIKAAEEEAQKTLEQKVAEREARIAELEAQISEGRQKADFVSRAAARGYIDPELAYLAAKAQGVLGEYDPKAGTVGEHDFEALETAHPTLAAQAAEEGVLKADDGDAGRRGRKATKTPNAVFNESIRGAIRGRVSQ